MELRHLRYFEAVATHGSFTHAADSLGISQPALSHQIKQLETEIGARLFDRLGRTIRLTPVGIALRPHARAAQRAVELAQNDTAEILNLTGGVLRIGAVQTFNTYLVPPVASQFRNRYPDVALRIFEQTGPRMEQQLIEGDLDLGVGFSLADKALIAPDPLFDEEMVAVVDANTQSASCLSLAEIVERPLALLTQPMFGRRLLDRCFAEAGVTPDPAMETNTIESLMRGVVGSDLYAIVPERAALNRSDVKAIRLVDPTPMRTAALLYCRGAFRSRASLEFERILKAEVFGSSER